MKTLQQWLHDMPAYIQTHHNIGWDLESSVKETVCFGPVLMELSVTRLDIEEKMNRTCVVIHIIMVAEDSQQQGWFKRVVTLLAVMSPVDYIYLECVRHRNLLSVLQHNGWIAVDHGDSSPDLYKSPKAILFGSNIGY
jgi:hypothetical protein